MFDDYVDKIIDSIEENKEAVELLREDFNKLIDSQEQKEEEVETQETQEQEDLPVDIESESNFNDSIIENLETLIQQNDEIITSLDNMNTSNVEGYWFLFISIVVALGLKVFFDNLMRW